MDAHIWKQRFFREALLMVVAAGFYRFIVRGRNSARVSLNVTAAEWLTIVANWKWEAVSKPFLVFSWFENIHSSFVSVFSF